MGLCLTPPHPHTRNSQVQAVPGYIIQAAPAPLNSIPTSASRIASLHHTLSPSSPPLRLPWVDIQCYESTSLSLLIITNPPPLGNPARSFTLSLNHHHHQATPAPTPSRAQQHRVYHTHRPRNATSTDHCTQPSPSSLTLLPSRDSQPSTDPPSSIRSTSRPPNSLQHVFRLDAPVLPGLRQADRGCHLLLRVLPPG